MKIRDGIKLPNIPCLDQKYTIYYMEHIFNVSVRETFVNTDSMDNSIILKIILGGAYKDELRSLYGYEPGHGQWPPYRYGDYAVLINVFKRFEQSGAIIIEDKLSH